jgi:uncharacterized membrane protein
MTEPEFHPLAEDYLQRLRQAGRHLPPDRLRDLLAEIEAHLSEAIPVGASDHDVLQVIDRLGPPGDIVDAEQPPAVTPVERRGRREWAAVILLPLGGLLIGIGWLIGLILLWTSRLWTTRDKLIGTLIVPGGIATAVAVVLVLTGAGASAQRCRQFVTAGHGSAIRSGVIHCRSVGAPSIAPTVWQIGLIVFLVVGPIVSAVYLARRAGRWSPTATTAVG